MTRTSDYDSIVELTKTAKIVTQTFPFEVILNDTACDQVEAEDVDLNFANDPIAVLLLDTRTVIISKTYKTTPTDLQATLCGYFDHSYNLPDFVTLDSSN